MTHANTTKHGRSLLVVIIFIVVIVAVFLIFVFLFFADGTQAERISGHDFKIAATLGTGDSVALFKFVSIKIEITITFGTQNHFLPPGTKPLETGVRPDRIPYGVIPLSRSE